MLYSEELTRFIDDVKDDGRIGPSHISLFIAILQYAEQTKSLNPVCVFSKDLMPLAKISATATFNKNIWELHNYGYITYEPSYNRFLGSLIFINEMSEHLKKEVKNGEGRKDFERTSRKDALFITERNSHV